MRRVQGSKQTLARHRAKAGPLAEKQVSKSTQTQYTFAVVWFFSWVAANRLTLPRDPWQIDLIVCEAVETLWQEGESRGMCGHLLSGLSLGLPPLRGHLSGAWRLWNAWGKQELPVRAPPLTLTMAQALATVSWEWGFSDVAVLIIIGFLCFLRTEEILSLRVKDIVFGSGLQSAHLQLPFTKGTRRSGGVEGVTLQCVFTVPVLKCLVQGLLPGDRLLRRSPLQFRRLFKAACSELRLDSRVRPYSLRRGGATHFFRVKGSMDEVMEAGRWRDQRTARIYVNTALLELHDLLLPKDDSRRVEAAAALLPYRFRTAAAR